MTSRRRPRFLMTAMALAAGLVLAAAPGSQAQQQVGSQSPFGYTGRIANTGFVNQGFQNTGITSVGFRNTGFQNAGFRNSAISNTGYRNGSSLPAFINLYNVPNNFVPNNTGVPNAPVNQGALDTSNIGNVGNVGYNQIQPQYGASPVQQFTNQSNYLAPDNTATITVGPATNLSSGFNIPQISRGARFTVGLGFESPVSVNTNPALGRELQAQFANSTRLTSGKNISVAVEDGVVVLRGKVADEHDRDLAEAMIRLNPGVYNVRNELQIGDVASNR